MHSAVFQVYAMCCEDQGKGKTAREVHSQKSYREVAVQLGALTPDMLLTLVRVNLFARLARRSPTGLFDALLRGFGAKRSWLAAVAADLSHLAKHAGFCGHGAVSWSIHEWWATARSDPPSFARQARKVVGLPIFCDISGRLGFL